MAKIKKLSGEVIGRIAAGEVVERPAAAIKELVENSVDAGATAITVEVADGGLTSLRVVDNGCGIEKEDLLMAFERHATSKLRTAEQLDEIASLGFRGEALASIAAVSKVTLITKTRQEDVGYKAESVGGDMADIAVTGAADGTSVLVKDLFFNAPVRRRFMKKPAQETQTAADLMRLFILSHPEISFRFKADGKTIYLSPGDGTVEAAFLSVYGLNVLKQMKTVDHTASGLIIQGLLGVGEQARGNRGHQSFFINGRALRSSLLSRAVEEGCRQRVMIGKFPMCVINIQMPYHLVDVNVHPNKWEVRFQEEKAVYQAVLDAVGLALRQQTPLDGAAPLLEEKNERKAPVTVIRQQAGEAPQPVLQASDMPAAFVRAPAAPSSQQPAHFMPAAPAPVAVVRDAAWQSAPLPKAEPKAAPAGQAAAPLSAPPEQLSHDFVKEAPMVLLGTAFRTYMILEKGDDLFLCDQHAMHERLLYERFQKAYKAGGLAQMLLSPVALHLSFRNYGTFLEHQAYLASLGFDAEDFGEQMVRLHAVPCILGVPQAERSFQEALDILEHEGGSLGQKTFERLVQMACKHAIKGGERVPDSALVLMLNELLKQNAMPTCPHGRPLFMKLTRQELEKRFGRIQP